MFKPQGVKLQMVWNSWIQYKVELFLSIVASCNSPRPHIGGCVILNPWCFSYVVYHIVCMLCSCLWKFKN
jgi:hypothetical protein